MWCIFYVSNKEEGVGMSVESRIAETAQETDVKPNTIRSLHLAKIPFEDMAELIDLTSALGTPAMGELRYLPATTMIRIYQGVMGDMERVEEFIEFCLETDFHIEWGAYDEENLYNSPYAASDEVEREEEEKPEQANRGSVNDALLLYLRVRE